MKFLNKPFLVILLLLLSFSTWSQKLDYSSLTIAEELKKDANDVVRLDQRKLVIESKKAASYQVKYVVTILNNKSDEDEQIVYYDDDIKINGLSVNVYDAFGKLVEKYNKTDFSDYSAIDGSTMYSDSRFKYINIDPKSYPFTIEFEYKQTFKGLITYPDCDIQRFNSSVENLVYTAEVPNDLDLRYKAKNIEIEPKITHSGNATTYIWTVNNRPAIKAEEFMPSYDQVLPFVKISPRYFQYNQYVGDASTWQSLGKFFYDIKEGRDVLSPEMAKTVRELTSGLDSNEEKIEVLYRYLQDNTRYVSVQLGIGGWQPFDAKYVEKNKYGDCKALSNFMLSMLKEVGIEAQPGKIFRSENTRIIVDESFPSNFSNHVLIYIPSEDIWLECTSNDYPVNYLGASNDGRSVLLFTEEGGQLTTSPAFNSSDNTQICKTDITIDINGSANITSSVQTKGPKHEIYREIENEISSKDFEKYFLRTSNLPAFTIETLDLKSKNDSPEAQLDFDITVGRYATKAGKRLFIPVNKLNAFEDVPSPTEKRIHPIEVLRGYQEFDKTTFELPEGYEVESIPNEDLALETAYGKYTVKIEVDGSKVTYNRMLEIQAVNLPAEEFEQFRNFYKEIAKADNMKIVLVKKKT